MSDYKKTLFLPKTRFPMKANLRQKEPETLKFWDDKDVYTQMVAASGQKGEYTLHDGPPYANGNIHLGTSMNKILKDIIVKSKNMAGYKAEYVPGWDCHGLPIEHKVSQELEKKNKVLPTIIIRKLCREYAEKYVKIQKKEFKRLGVLGTWEDPYLTMKPEYEAATAGELGKFMAQGMVYRGKKPIHWCSSCSTALAEAEVEYEDHTSPSIFVRFPIAEDELSKLGAAGEKARGAETFIAIWTTTPWTIPDNMAVAVHPDFDYVLVKAGGANYILAQRLLPVCAEIFGWDEYETLAEMTGQDLEGLVAAHPIYDRPSPVVLADYVTLDSGTGCVHTAPGHGREDFETGMKYGLEVLSPMDDNGCFLPVVEHFGGMSVWDANPKVISMLEENGNLLAKQTITHSYPHCWRCKKPVIFRATTQWFISMEQQDLRQKALKAIRDDVKWIPSWGEDRIYSMIENRPDWCISRQRNWGVPIIALICKDCDEVYHDPEWVQGVVEKFAQHKTGCDWWFETELEDMIPEGLTCPKCGGKHWEKEDDILDVWFDSGTSFAAVVEKRPECSYPADLYLEGSDQHRGWFHSSLLASVGTRGQAPYKSVVTHGYVVDGDGRKMSKSIGNVVAPQEIIDKYGAEILRLWVSAVNYQEDVRISDEILNRLVDTYRRVRNTCRFILGNLSDFDPAENAVKYEDMPSIDRYALDILSRADDLMKTAYEHFEFHKVHHCLHNLCVTDLSAFYLDLAKDRLYVDQEESVSRRSAQTVLWKTIMVMLQNMAPVLSFTAEEVFSCLPESIRPKADTVFAMGEMEALPKLGTEDYEDWKLIAAVRSEVQKAIEPLRKSKEVGHSLDTHIVIYAPESVHEAIARQTPDLPGMLIVSQVTLEKFASKPDGIYLSEEVDELAVDVQKAKGEKCARCWRYDEKTGQDQDYPDVCPRCAHVLSQI